MAVDCGIFRYHTTSDDNVENKICLYRVLLHVMQY